MSRLPRAVWVPAVVVGWIAVVLVLDSGAGLGVQRLLGAATWLLLVGLLAGECRSVRLQVAAVVVAATALEYTASVLMGLYTYRLENVPAFVPPGHGLVYLAALTIGGAVARTQGYRPFVLAALVLAAGWAAYGLLLSARPDTGGAVLFVFLAGFLVRGRQPAVYAAAFFVTGYLELLGTGIGTWAWAREDFLGVTTLGNPPSGIAGGYGWLDMVGILVAARFAATAAPVPAPAPAPPLVPAPAGR
jgi:hypothetical protein